MKALNMKALKILPFAAALLLGASTVATAQVSSGVTLGGTPVGPSAVPGGPLGVAPGFVVPGTTGSGLPGTNLATQGAFSSSGTVGLGTTGTTLFPNASSSDQTLGRPLPPPSTTTPIGSSSTTTTPIASSGIGASPNLSIMAPPPGGSQSRGRR